MGAFASNESEARTQGAAAVAQAATGSYVVSLPGSRAGVAGVWLVEVLVVACGGCCHAMRPAFYPHLRTPLELRLRWFAAFLLLPFGFFQ